MKSHCDYETHKLQKEEARKLLAKVIRSKDCFVVFSKHARDELKKDDIPTSHVFNVLASSDAQILGDGELEKGTYRYRVETKNICVVIVFKSDTEAMVVTAWRKKR